MSVTAGTFVNDNVRLARPLASGAMGQVWVADHLTLKIPVAVKLMHDKLPGTDDSAAVRFSEEASTAARIKSQHVVQTFDSGVMKDGTPFIVMELLEGESLQARLTREGRMTVAETARVVEQVCEALEAAHRIGTVHRDIKPENVFVTTRDAGLAAKVFDFGIATSMALPDGWEASGDMAGTPPFLSPEQFRGEDVDHHADLWAVAVMAYLCITGKLPFEGATLGLLSVSVMSGTFALPSHLRSDLPPQLDGWFDKAFTYEKERRFQSARDMGEAFARAASVDTARTRTYGAIVWGGALVALAGIAALTWIATRDDIRGVRSVPPRASAKAVGEAVDDVVAAAPRAAVSEKAVAPTTALVPLPGATTPRAAASSPTMAPATPPPRKMPAPPPTPHSPTKGSEDYGF